MSTGANTVVDTRVPEDCIAHPIRTADEAIARADTKSSDVHAEGTEPQRVITFDATAEKTNHPKMDTTLYIPGPRERDNGHPLVELNKEYTESQDGKICSMSPPICYSSMRLLGL